MAKNDNDKDRLEPADERVVLSGSGDLGDDKTVSSVNPNVSVTAKPGESAESLLRRFRQKVKESGVLEKLEEIRFYQRPSQR